MIRAFSRWLFMRTHRQELIQCARFARSAPTPDSAFSAGQRDGILIGLETLELLA